MTLDKFGMTANYHTHTIRCNHASGTDREYVEAAIAAGFKTLGFSDHSPYYYWSDPACENYPFYMMKREEAAEYFDEMAALVKKGIRENDTVKIYDIEFDYVE